VDNRKDVDDYISKHPEVVRQYNRKVSKTRGIGGLNSADMAARFLKRKGIDAYNPGDPNYVKMYNEDLAAVRNDPAIRRVVGARKKGGILY
jgi:hypothetical protein